MIDLKTHILTSLLLKYLDKLQLALPWVRLTWGKFYRSKYQTSHLYMLLGVLSAPFWWRDVIALIDNYRLIAHCYPNKRDSSIKI